MSGYELCDENTRRRKGVRGSLFPYINYIGATKPEVKHEWRTAVVNGNARNSLYYQAETVYRNGVMGNTLLETA